MKHIRFITFILTIIIFTAAFAADLFTVDNIKVNKTGTSGKQAKEDATISGEREAFTKLIERIAPDNHTIANSIDAAKISDLVQGIEVNDEKVTATYYSATLSISFNRSLVDKFLSENNVAFSAKKSAPIVLIPLYIENGQNTLFEPENPLLKGLATKAKDNPVLNIIVPDSLRGVDKAKLSQNIEEITAETKESLLKVGKNYNADKLILIVALKEPGALNVRLIDLKNSEDTVKEIPIKVSDQQPGEDLFACAARNINSVLEKQWVQGKIDGNLPRTKFSINVPISNLGEWIALRRKLEGLPFLKDVTVKSLTTNNALIDVSFVDTFEKLQEKMDEQGFTLENTNDTITLHIKAKQTIKG